MSDFSKFSKFDEVHVISDIHMGGKPGFQILRETKRLSGYIDWVRNQCKEGNVALVLNGDVFDTLAEDIRGYVAIDDAIQTIERIMNDPSFSGIWSALSDFVKTERRTLIFVIGNHDIEIAFPNVQNLILWRLAGDDLTQRARVVFSTIGAGYTCMVGGSTVYCTHGNEVDDWNINRYEDLSRVSRRINAGLSFSNEEWHANAGTRMVKEIMNKVKQRYKWIDLLKPETSAAVGTLLALEPSMLGEIKNLLPILGEKRQASSEVDQRLSIGTPSANATPASTNPVTVNQLLGKNIIEGIKQPLQSKQPVDDMLDLAEKNLGDRNKLIVSHQEQLGTGQLVWDRLTSWFTGVSKDESLRRALLDWLENDKTFDIQDQDETYKGIIDKVGASIDFIVTGHTHLERAIDMGGGRFYFNTGTWIRLLRFTTAMLKDDKSFKPVYELLVNNQGRIEAIDDAKFDDGTGKMVSFVMDQTSAVWIKKQKDGTVSGHLLHVEGDGAGQPKEIKKFERN